MLFIIAPVIISHRTAVGGFCGRLRLFSGRLVLLALILVLEGAAAAAAAATAASWMRCRHFVARTLLALCPVAQLLVVGVPLGIAVVMVLGGGTPMVMGVSARRVVVGVWRGR